MHLLSQQCACSCSLCYIHGAAELYLSQLSSCGLQGLQDAGKLRDMLNHMCWMIRARSWQGLVPSVDQDGGSQLRVDGALHIRRQAISNMDRLQSSVAVFCLITMRELL